MKSLFVLIFTPVLSWAACSGNVVSKNDVTVRLYAPKSPTLRQVVILPPTGGENRADRKLAKSLCKKGHQVKVVDYPQPEITAEDFDGHERVTKNIVTTLDGFFQNEIRPTTVVGASLGGIYATLLYSLSQNPESPWKNLSVIDSLVTTVAGGPLPQVLSYSSLDGVRTVRSQRFKTGRFSGIEDYQNFLDQIIFTDVIKLSRTNGNVLFYGSTNDTVVPTATQKNLAEKLKGETHWIKGLGHSKAVAYVYYFRDDQISRFMKKLSAEKLSE